MNVAEKTFSMSGFSAEALLPYELIATERCFSLAAVQAVYDRSISSHCLPCGRSFMLTIDVKTDTLYQLSLDAMRRLSDAVFTVACFSRQPGAYLPRQIRRFASKAQSFAMPIVRRMVNLRL